MIAALQALLLAEPSKVGPTVLGAGVEKLTEEFYRKSKTSKNT